MFKKNKKENEVVRMEESTFLKRHAGKILLAGGLVVAAGAYYMLGKHEKEMKDVLADNAALKYFLEEDGKAIAKLTEDNETLMAAASEGLFEEALATTTRKLNSRKDRKEFLLNQEQTEEVINKLKQLTSEIFVLEVRKERFSKAQALLEIKELD